MDDDDVQLSKSHEAAFRKFEGPSCDILRTEMPTLCILGVPVWSPGP